MIDPGDLRDVFDRAASLPPQDRAAFLARACGDNVALRQEVERLLAADQRAGSVFDSGSSGSDSSAERGPAARDDTSALQSGSRLGPYVILGPAGRGGMGEVYRARDTRLDRTVALKVLPSELVRDAVARRRFEREARAAAALSHPHICTLLDIGRQDETDFLVMEFVDGDTLAHRLARETPPLRESLRIGIEIGEALAAAHAAHIVHRDIKPGNVMLRPDGFVKVLDFGLAKLTPLATDGGGDTTRALSTRAGLIVGTVAYMSPEQARGQDVDARTDVWSLGCVLYEMAAGRTPFAGTSTTDVLAAVLQSDPIPLPVIDARIPAELQRIVAKALKKDRNERYQTAQDLLLDLRELREEIPRSGSRGAESVSPAASSVRMARLSAGRLSQIMGVAALLALGVVTAWLRSRTGMADVAGSSVPSQHVQRSLTRLTFDAGLQTDPAFSPDGRLIAYASDKGGNFDIWVQPVSGGNAVQVTKSPAAETQPAWSPDGSTIAFRSERDGGGLYLVPFTGGQERLLVSAGNHPSWSPDGREIRYFVDSLMQHDIRLMAVAVSGGAPHKILPGLADLPGAWFWAAPHPDGRLSFMGWPPNSGFGFYTTSSDGKVVRSEIKNLPTQLSGFLNGARDTYGRHFCWNANGTGLILETLGDNGASNLWSVAVDPTTLEWKSFEQLTTGPGADVKAVLSADGRRVLFTTLRTSVRAWRFPLNARGRLTPPGRAVTEDQAEVMGLSASHDGRLLVYNFQRVGSPSPSLWQRDLSSDTSGPIDAADGDGAIVSPDGQFVAYSREGSHGRTSDCCEGWYAVFTQRLGATARQITALRRGWAAACDWNTSSNELLVSRGSALEAWPTTAAEPPVAPRLVLKLREPQGIFQARVSPNGRWLAFVAAQEARVDIGFTTASGPADRSWTPVVTDFSWIDKPRWARDGRILYFLARKGLFLNLWAIGFDPERGTTIGNAYPVTQYDSPAFCIDPRIAQADMDVADGAVFLAMRSASGNIWMLDNVDR